MKANHIVQLEKRGGLPKIHKWKACMLDKDDYLEKYNLNETFEKSGLDWNVLVEIHEDYTAHNQELNEVCEKLEAYLIDNIKKNLVQKLHCHIIPYEVELRIQSIL